MNTLYRFDVKLASNEPDNGDYPRMIAGKYIKEFMKERQIPQLSFLYHDADGVVCTVVGHGGWSETFIYDKDVTGGDGLDVLRIGTANDAAVYPTQGNLAALKKKVYHHPSANTEWVRRIERPENSFPRIGEFWSTGDTDNVWLIVRRKGDYFHTERVHNGKHIVNGEGEYIWSIYMFRNGHQMKRIEDHRYVKADS